MILSEPEVLEGQLERITYSSPDTGYTVAKMRVAGRREPVTVVGNLLAPAPGEILKITGQWTRHPRFGEQFQAETFQTLAPSSMDGITKYLSSGLIKGIGPVMAKRIVKKFGVSSLKIVENQAERLLEVEGLGPKRLEMIRQAWAEQKEIRRVMIFLQEYGVGTAHAARIFKNYGDRAVEVIRQNPYRLADEITGIGFRTADQIAERLGVPKDSPVRVGAGLLYVLQETAGEGHVFYPYEELLEKCRELLDTDRENAAKALAAAAAERRVYIEDLNRGEGEFRPNHKAVYLAGYYTSEDRTAARLRALMEHPRELRIVNPDQAAAWAEKKLGLSLAGRQKEAVKRAAKDKVLVITGGPGTGKTTIIRAVLAVYQRFTGRIFLAAPTGRAAKRMSEATGYEARTIHRLLEMDPAMGRFKRDEQNPLQADFLILDEASMIDITLMHHLLKALPPETTLILVGDVDQLPSVGPGNVLKDIIDSKAAPVVKLTEIFRQARESAIIVNAHRINQGLMPRPNPPEDRLEDFYFIERPKPEDALETVLELVTSRIPKRFGFDPARDIQVLTPMHRGTAGAENLNAELKKRLNPGAKGITRGARHLAVGDKVMQIRNNYDKEVFNGDIGMVSEIDLERQSVKISFDDLLVPYDFFELDEIVPAYAVTVHKSQGSEYPAVVMPVLGQHYILLQRNLIYTAVTRGRNLVVLVGAHKALALALKNDQAGRRYTRLAERLRQDRLF